MQPVRAQLRDLFRAAQWLCRFTFRENDYQQTLELECRHLTPCLRASRAEAVVAPEALNRKVSHCQMKNGCPVAPLATLQVDAQLGLISVDDVEASCVRCLVAFNDKQLPDHCRKLCSRTTRPPRQCASSAPWTAYCLPRLPQVRRAG